MIKDLINRLVNEPLLRFKCGFLVSDVVPSEASYSRMIDVIGQSDVLDFKRDTLVQTAFRIGLICVEHLAIDATYFKSRDAANGEKGTRTTPKAWTEIKRRRGGLASEFKANQSTYEKESGI
mgnify:CR=1 FL=1